MAARKLMMRERGQEVREPVNRHCTRSQSAHMSGWVGAGAWGGGVGGLRMHATRWQGEEVALRKP
jgi:hypothetical protein